MDAAAVAKAGFAGFRAGKRVVVPGLWNKVLTAAARFSPPGLPAAIARALHEG